MTYAGVFEMTDTLRSRLGAVGDLPSTVLAGPSWQTEDVLADRHVA
ncbi:hypothetical protein [Oricola indica]|nr:hypothetical protein [Oricola indica]